jgi:hypothetical protein
MQNGGNHIDCTKKIELLIATRAEDFTELSNKIAEIQKIQNTKLQALAERVTVLEENIAKTKFLARCLSK